MKNLIESNLIEILASEKKAFLNDDTLISYEKMTKEFENLVEEGFAKRRENNTLSFIDSHLHRTELNSYVSNFHQQNFGIMLSK